MQEVKTKGRHFLPYHLVSGMQNDGRMVLLHKQMLECHREHNECALCSLMNLCSSLWDLIVDKAFSNRDGKNGSVGDRDYKNFRDFVLLIRRARNRMKGGII